MAAGSASATASLSVAAAALRMRQPRARAPTWAAPSQRQQRPLLKLNPCASLAAAPPLWRAESDAAGGGPGSGDVTGRLLRERIVFLGNEIEDFLADAVVSQLLLLDAIDPPSDIRLFVNSPGGSLRSTFPSILIFPSSSVTNLLNPIQERTCHYHRNVQT
uniref:ATP-dependent Clp protease proteolytic subunit n=1 Tax=Arundo donax TaxID=35708 RepID=A0A0A9AAB1_ARUDO